MALEDVLKGYETLNSIRGIAQLRSETGKEAQTFDSWVDYIAKEENYSPEQKAGMSNNTLFQNNKVQFGRLMDGELEQKTRDFYEAMNKEYKTAVNELPEKYAFAYAISLPDKDKKWLAIQKAIDDKNWGAAKKAYSDLKDKPRWKAYVDSMTESEVREYLPYFVAQTQREFVESKLSDKVNKKDKDGNVKKDKKGKIETEYVPNLDKIRNYIIKTIESYKDNAGLKGNAYETLVQVYNQFKEDNKKKKK